MRTAIAIALLGLIALALFNPGMDDFKLFVQERSELIFQQEAGDTELGRALSGIGGSLAGRYVDRITERRTYVIFSTYTIDLDGPDEDANEWRFLGIAGTFVETQRPEFLSEG